VLALDCFLGYQLDSYIFKWDIAHRLEELVNEMLRSYFKAGMVMSRLVFDTRVSMRKDSVEKMLLGIIERLGAL
jgi:hypothetical protein